MTCPAPTRGRSRSSDVFPLSRPAGEGHEAAPVDVGAAWRGETILGAGRLPSAPHFIFGSDVVAPADAQAQIKVFDMYAPLWKLLTPEASQKVRVGNYARLFDEGRRRVRAWEAANVKSGRQ